jgi:hypothetical protein
MLEARREVAVVVGEEDAHRIGVQRLRVRSGAHVILTWHCAIGGLRKTTNLSQNG